MPSFRELVQAQAKAITPNPAFANVGRPVGVVDLNKGKIPGQNPNSGISGGPRKAHQSAGRHLQAYGGVQAMDWVMDCARFTGDTVANADYHFEKVKKPTAEKIPGDPVEPPEGLSNLLKKPNPYMDYIEMMELMVIDLLLVGNAYWLKWRTNEKGQPLALYRLAPPYVEVTTESWGAGTYIYKVPNAGELEVPAAEVIHFKLANPDPENPFYGLGLISGAGRSADLELALTDSQSSYFENHTMPSATLTSDRRVPRDVFKKIRAQMRSRAQGPKNSGELLVLEAGLKLTPIAPNATDAAFLELSKMSRDRVFSWFRMSPKLVGIEDGGTEKLADVQRQYDMRTARPLMNKVQTKVTEELTESWDLSYVLDYEYQLTPEQQATLGATWGKFPGITVDEARAFAKLGKHKEKDIGEITLNLPGENGGTGQPGETASRNGFPDRNLPGEAGRPPKSENTKQFPKSGKALPAGSSARQPKKEGKSIEEIRARLDELPETKATEAPGVPPEDTLHPRRIAEVDSIAASFQSALASAALSLEHGLIEAAGKPEGKALPSDLVNKIKNTEAWKDFVKTAEEAYEHALVKAMSAATVHHGDIGVQPSGEIDYEALIKKMIADRNNGPSAISSTLKKSVINAVKEAKSPDAAITDVQAAIEQAVADWSEGKAEVIAMTEASRAYNLGTIEVAKSAGHDKVLVSDGTDFDEPCVEANGSIWSLDQAIANPLQHPNCRRGFVPVK